MAGKENPIISALDDANAMQEKIRMRTRWLATQLSGKDLRAAEQWLLDIIQATEVTQVALRELRPKPPARREAERQADFDEAPELYQQLL